MKKLWRIVVFVLLLVMVFGGCGSENVTDDTFEQTSPIEQDRTQDDGRLTEDKASENAGNKDKSENVQEHGDENGNESNSVIQKNEGTTEAANYEQTAEAKANGAVADKKNNDDSAVNEYKRLIEDSFSAFDGKLSYGIHMYDSGEVSFYNNTQMKSASVIKLFIMEYAYHMMQNGEADDDTVVSGSKLSSLIERMITVSDNDATNAIIKHFGMEKINGYIADNYSETALQRKMLDFDAAARGEENYTSVSDIMKFLDKLYKNRETYPYNEMLNIMKKQQISTKLRRNMPQGVKMASKTGELSDVENDVAIVFTEKGDYAIVCLTKGGSSEKARNAMATACRRIYDELQSE